CALCVIDVTSRGPIGSGIRPGVRYGIGAMLLRGSVPGLVRPAAGTGPVSPGPQGRGPDLRAFLRGPQVRPSLGFLLPAVPLSPATRERRRRARLALVESGR